MAIGAITLLLAVNGCGQYDANRLPTFKAGQITSDASDGGGVEDDAQPGQPDAIVDSGPPPDLGFDDRGQPIDTGPRPDMGFPPDAIADAGFPETGPRDIGFPAETGPRDNGVREDIGVDVGFPPTDTGPRIDAGHLPHDTGPGPIDSGMVADGGDAGQPDAFVPPQPCSASTGWRCIPPTGPQGFLMGAGVPGQTPHTVVITRPFWVRETELTQAEWAALGGTAPSTFAACGSNCPAESMSFIEQIALLNRNPVGNGPCYQINGSTVEWVTPPGESSPLDCTGNRLCTEAEWEYAARADGSTWWLPLGNVAWYDANSGGQTHPVNTLNANPGGARHMLGNVRELVWGEQLPYPTTTQIDPIYGGFIADANWRPVARGGAYQSPAAMIHPGARETCSSQDCRGSNTGLRICRTVLPPPP